MSDLTQELQRLGGTNAQASDVQAANAWAGTTGLELTHAINVACGTSFLPIQQALNVKAGTTQLDAVAAAALIATGPSVRGSAAVVGTTMAVTVQQSDFDVAPQSGDLLVAFFFVTSTEKKKKGYTIGTAPAGFTERIDSGDSHQVIVSTKTAGSSEGDYEWAGSWVTYPATAIVVAVKDWTAFDAVQVDINNSGAGPFPAVTATTDSSLLLAASHLSNANSGPVSVDAALTVLTADIVAVPLGVAWIGYETLTASGDSGTRSIDWDGSYNEVSVTCAIS